MTWTDHGGASPGDCRTLLLLGLVTSAAAADVVLLPVDFAWHYFMNDLVRAADHVAFLRWAGEGTLVLSAVQAVVVARRTPLPLARCAVGCLLVSASVLLVVAAGYAVLSLDPALDPAIGGEVPNRFCALLAVVLGAAAAGSFAVGGHVLLLSRHRPGAGGPL